MKQIVQILSIAFCIGALLGWYSVHHEHEVLHDNVVDELARLAAIDQADSVLDRRRFDDELPKEKEPVDDDNRYVKSSIQCLLNGHVCMVEWVAIVDNTFVVFGGDSQVGNAMRQSGSRADGSLGSTLFGMLEAMRIHEDQRSKNKKPTKSEQIFNHGSGGGGGHVHDELDALDDDDAIEWIRSEWPWRVSERDLDLHAARVKGIAVPERNEIATFFHFHETRDAYTALNDNVFPLIMGVFAAEQALIDSGAISDASMLRFDLFSTAAHSSETLSSASAPILHDVVNHMFRSTDGRIDWLLADSKRAGGVSAPRIFRRLVWIEPRQLRPLEPNTDGHFFFKRAPNLYGASRWRELVDRLYPRAARTTALLELTLDDLKAGGRAGDMEHRRELQRRLHRDAADHADDRPLAEAQLAGQVPPRIRFIVPATATEAIERRQVVGHQQLIRLSSMIVAGGIDTMVYVRHNFRRQVLDTQRTDVLMGVADAALANAVFLPPGAVVVQFSCQCIDADELRRAATISALFDLYYIDVPCPCADLTMFPNSAPTADSCASIDHDEWSQILLRSINTYKQSLRETLLLDVQ